MIDSPCELDRRAPPATRDPRDGARSGKHRPSPGRGCFGTRGSRRSSPSSAGTRRTRESRPRATRRTSATSDRPDNRPASPPAASPNTKSTAASCCQRPAAQTASRPMQPLPGRPAQALAGRSAHSPGRRDPGIVADVSQLGPHAVQCPNCSCVTRAKLPRGVPRGTVGPHLMAFITLFIDLEPPRGDSPEHSALSGCTRAAWPRCSRSWPTARPSPCALSPAASPAS